MNDKDLWSEDQGYLPFMVVRFCGSLQAKQNLQHWNHVYSGEEKWTYCMHNPDSSCMQCHMLPMIYLDQDQKESASLRAKIISVNL